MLLKVSPTLFIWSRAVLDWHQFYLFLSVFYILLDGQGRLMVKDIIFKKEHL